MVRPGPTLREEAEGILADGLWHSWRQVFFALAEKIRPEVAIREYHQGTRPGRPRVHEETLEVQIEKGKARVLNRALQALGVEYRGRSIYDPDRDVRLDPYKGEATTLRDQYGVPAVRALASIACVDKALGKVPVDDLTPLQRYWWEKATGINVTEGKVEV